jgi:Uma2 family endonuclease
MRPNPLVPPDEERDDRVAPWQWTRETYYKAGQAGVFHDGERVELIEGVVYRRTRVQSPQHANAIARGRKLLETRVGHSFFVQAQLPVSLDLYSEPEPDLAIVHGSLDRYERDHPGGGDVALAIEVAEGTFSMDGHRKANLYARFGIPEYWILVLPARYLVTLRNPSPHGYQTRFLVEEERMITPLFAPEIEILVSDLLPKA